MDESPDASRSKILVVDDNEDIITLTRRILERYDYEILTAANGTRGLQAARKELPDLVLLDIMLPEMDGLQVCRALKGDAETRKIMIILVTGRGSTTDLVEGLEAGADDYITKPFHLTELMARVRCALRVKDLADEVEQRNRELLLSQRELLKSEKMATIGLLSTGIAHEFNNIMSGISGFAQLAETNPEYKDRLVELTRSQCARALQITRSLSTFSGPTVELGCTDIVPEIENALCLVTKQIKEKDIDVVTEFTTTPAVIAQPGHLQEVFLNLVINACQAVQTGGHITIRTEHDRSRVRVVIEDDGSGISPEHVDRIFDPFFTTKGALGGGTGSGSGLGLSVSYNIVSSYGGRLDVRSEVDHGATFTVSIPIAPDSIPIAPDNDGSRDGVATAASRKLKIPSSRSSILIADPEECVHEMIGDCLCNWDVSSCSSWREVHEILDRESFDLAIIDTGLQGDGAFAQDFEDAREAHPEMPILLTTSNYSEERFRTARSRTDFHLLKPYSMENLSNVLLVEKSRGRLASCT